MPDRSDDYQLPSWPKTRLDRELWNVVMLDIAVRLKAREELEASFELLQEQGVQAALDYIQVSVAPQLSDLQEAIAAAQSSIDEILGGTAPNAEKFAGHLPAYFATAQALSEGLDQIEAQVQQAVAALVDSSPTALDTLKELASALGNDPSFSVTVMNAIGGKASKAGDKFTGAIDLSGNALLNAGKGVPDYLKRLKTSRTGAFTVSIASGEAKANGKFVENVAAFSKRLDAAWAAGSGNGGLDTGVVVANQWYHIHVLRKQSDGTFDAALSLSAAGPNMALLGGFDVIMRIGAIRTNSSANIIDYVQEANLFMMAEVQDFLANSSAAQALMTVSVPSGVKVLAFFRFQAQLSGGSSDVGITLAPGDNAALVSSQFYSGQPAGSVPRAEVSIGQCMTNASAQIYRTATVLGGGGQTAIIHTYGWEDITIPRIG